MGTFFLKLIVFDKMVINNFIVFYFKEPVQQSLLECLIVSISLIYKNGSFNGNSKDWNFNNIGLRIMSTQPKVYF